MIKKEQVYDLYIAGYTIIEISNILKCSERTVRRKLKEVNDEKGAGELRKLQFLGINIETISDNNIKLVRYKRVQNKNEVIKLYLDGYTAKEIEEKENYRRSDIYNIIRSLKRYVGFKKFEEIYEKIHNKNREKLLLLRKKEKYNKELVKLTGQEVRGYISDNSLFPLVKSAYECKAKSFVLTSENKKIATWDLPVRYY
ncbi:hypothetical protein NSA50_17100 [Clostridium sp. DSM 100503]|uniref:hypothetical protein n=1 Tax=Clostridium sp. DSM 100503 TaxID=2963282 RepID=UPI002149CEF7|nr:hypothetical protein [Clostridium sp. DSM 100503]MCR1952743.1 hypothetical protein [Clostridium sp. DSM 100503]